MKDGWQGDEYFALAENQDEAARLTHDYGIASALPDYFFVGLRGWDDFIVCDVNGGYFTVPTVPLSPRQLAPFRFPSERMRLAVDPQHTGKVKWYIKPVVFGGDPKLGPNVTWISYGEHIQVVRYWNRLYDELNTKVANRNEAEQVRPDNVG